MGLLDSLIPGAGLVTGIIGGIGGLISAGGANKKLDQLLKQDPTYQANPLASQRLGLAQTLLNARMPGASSVERNIYGNQANQLANVNRNATDGSQALAAGAAAQGQTNQAFQQLGQQESQDYQRRYGNLVGAQQGEIQEGDKVYQDQVRRFSDLAQIRGAQNQNTQAAWQGIANLGGGVGSFGLAGGFSKMFGGQGQGQSSGGGSSVNYYGNPADSVY